MNYRLSDRAKVLLVLISDHTEVINGDFSRPESIFIPPSGTKVAYLKSVRLDRRFGRGGSDDSVFVDGSGDARILKSLERKGLTRPHHVVDYAYSVTEDGRVEAERILSANEIGERR